MLLIVPAVTRTNDSQLSFVKGRSKHERFKIAIGSDADTPIMLHLVLKQRACLIPARTLKSNWVGLTGRRKVLREEDRSCPQSRGKCMSFLDGFNDIDTGTAVGFEDKKGEQSHCSSASNQNSFLRQRGEFAHAF